MTARHNNENGVWVPAQRLRHQDAEYDEVLFDIIVKMQREHFWYKGRHKLLLYALRHEVVRHFERTDGLRGIDLGGGCGGWLSFLNRAAPELIENLALGDSSLRALTLAEPVVGSHIARYQVDLKSLDWTSEWDIIFLLDVLEHIPEQEQVLRQVHKSLRPGGLLFITVPALQLFWSYNDEWAGHQRRYCEQDFVDLAAMTGYTLLRTNYYMFFLSPALVMSRWLSRPRSGATRRQRREYMARAHRIPPLPINKMLTAIFGLEASLVNRFGFPWGTSLLAVLKHAR